MFNFSLALLIICIWYWYMIFCIPKLVQIPYADANFKTGDLILFHAYDNINPVFIGSFWGHIGIVYKDPDDANAKPLLFEAARTTYMKNCPSYNKHGIMITDLKTRLEKYPGMIACKSLNRPILSEIIRGFTELMKYAKENMHYNDSVIYNGIKKKIGDPLNHGTNCGELVTLSLIKLGLIPADTLNQKIGHHLLYNVKLTELQNNYYHEPVEITFNPF